MDLVVVVVVGESYLGMIMVMQRKMIRVVNLILGLSLSTLSEDVENCGTSVVGCVLGVGRDDLSIKDWFGDDLGGFAF